MKFTFRQVNNQWETTYTQGNVKGGYITTSRTRAIQRATTMIERLIAGKTGFSMDVDVPE